jgi:hypothetical protein
VNEEYERKGSGRFYVTFPGSSIDRMGKSYLCTARSIDVRFVESKVGQVFFSQGTLFFSGYFVFPLAVSFHTCSYLIYLPPTI